MRILDATKRDYQRILVDVLYAILQHLSSSNFACAAVAKFALDQLAEVGWHAYLPLVSLYQDYF